MGLEYHNPAVAGPYDFNPTASKEATAEGNDCLLSDLNEKLLFTEVSDLLGVKYLSVFDGEDCTCGHGKGTVYGAYNRPIVSLPVRIGCGKPINVHFMVDTGAPRSEIPINVYERLVGSDHVPNVFNGVVANSMIQLGICSPTGNHRDIPLLGQDYLQLLRATLIVDYAEKSTKIVVK